MVNAHQTDWLTNPNCIAAFEITSVQHTSIVIKLYFILYSA